MNAEATTEFVDVNRDLDDAVGGDLADDTRSEMEEINEEQQEGEERVKEEYYEIDPSVENNFEEVYPIDDEELTSGFDFSPLFSFTSLSTTSMTCTVSSHEAISITKSAVKRIKHYLSSLFQVVRRFRVGWSSK